MQVILPNLWMEAKCLLEGLGLVVVVVLVNSDSHCGVYLETIRSTDA